MSAVSRRGRDVPQPRARRSGGAPAPSGSGEVATTGPDVEEIGVGDPGVGNPDLEGADVGEPDSGDPDSEEPDLEEPDLEEPDLEEPDSGWTSDDDGYQEGDTDPDGLDEHGIARSFRISWEPPLPLMAAAGSFMGAFVLSTFALALVLQAGLYPIGTVAGQFGGYVATGQAPNVQYMSSTFVLYAQAASQTVFWGVLVGPALYLAFKRGRGPAADLGLRLRARDVPLGAAVGAGAQLVMIPLLYLLTRPIIGDRDVSAPAREFVGQGQNLAGRLVVLLIAVIGAPIAEEIYFRGLVLRASERRFGPTAALVGTSAFFAVSHLQPLQFPGLLVFGVVLGWLALRTGRLGMPIAAHLTFNLTTVIALWFFPSLPL